ncbi:UDP-2-acetamido-3-amino-2,3-dideoxy-glucuronate N-acetyltransferase [Cryobacterium sp. MP_3.1]|uniref:acyltransferase n=1 Tax=Cryobacterium TaxID=69578 RepID=UPI001FAFA3DB|nr:MULTISPECIES: acyltransferase [Cryobacterium]MEC5184916.1 UDP-2-acetamido-3-amino-2,3-dideoxy-glucuronate N-acetyltransferase [Cryobacterium sp. MP_3.1]
MTTDAGAVRATWIAPSADIDPRAVLGAGSTVADRAQVREFARVGPGCAVGYAAYLGPGVILGRQCTVQDFALLYEPTLLEDRVSVGPGAVFTNDRFPRAVVPSGRLKSAADWVLVGVTVRTGASVGANAVCVAPLTIGRWAIVADGSVVTADVPEYALMDGIPARRVHWVGQSGARLNNVGPGLFRCPVTGAHYSEHDGTLRPLGIAPR